MMTVSVNNQRQSLPQPCSVSEALGLLGYQGAKIAVAVNSIFVPRSEYASYQLCDDDCIDVLIPVQGG